MNVISTDITRGSTRSMFLIVPKGQHTSIGGSERRSGVYGNKKFYPVLEHPVIINALRDTAKSTTICACRHPAISDHRRPLSQQVINVIEAKVCQIIPQPVSTDTQPILRAHSFHTPFNRDFQHRYVAAGGKLRVH